MNAALTFEYGRFAWEPGICELADSTIVKKHGRWRQGPLGDWRMELTALGLPCFTSSRGNKLASWSLHNVLRRRRKKWVCQSVEHHHRTTSTIQHENEGANLKFWANLHGGMSTSSLDFEPWCLARKKDTGHERESQTFEHAPRSKSLTLLSFFFLAASRLISSSSSSEICLANCSAASLSARWSAVSSSEGSMASERGSSRDATCRSAILSAMDWKDWEFDVCAG